VQTTTNRALIKQRAEDLAVQLIENNLVTDDPMLQGAAEKLRPFRDKLGQVGRDLIGKGLAMVPIEETDDVEAGAKRALVALVDKLWGMRLMLGIG
jgi:hypothetical protein